MRLVDYLKSPKDYLNQYIVEKKPNGAISGVSFYTRVTYSKRHPTYLHGFTWSLTKGTVFCTLTMDSRFELIQKQDVFKSVEDLLKEYPACPIVLGVAVGGIPEDLKGYI